MSQGPKISEDAASLRRGNFSYFPVISGRLEFSIQLRRAILRERPKIVAVELPGSLEDVYLQALARLPEMSVILYPDPQDEERGIYVPVEPCDPFTEAVRSALEIDAEVIFIEPDSGDRPHLPDAYPDPYSIRYIGMEKYIEAYRVYPQERNDDIAAHAAGMAWKLQGTDPLAQVFVVVSLNFSTHCWTQWKFPRTSRAAASRPRSGCSIRIPTVWPRLPSSIRTCRIVTRRFARK